MLEVLNFLIVFIVLLLDFYCSRATFYGCIELERRICRKMARCGPPSLFLSFLGASQRFRLLTRRWSLEVHFEGNKRCFLMLDLYATSLFLSRHERFCQRIFMSCYLVEKRHFLTPPPLLSPTSNFNERVGKIPHRKEKKISPSFSEFIYSIYMLYFLVL
ncbi:hypothetical protein CHUAL_014011 [Chamberlinius hualienensis]